MTAHEATTAATAAAAATEAIDAARVAAVSIESVDSPDELDELRSIMEAIWGPAIVPPRNLLRGLALGGSCLLLARRSGRPVGFALGWLGWEGGVHLHSHQVGATVEERRTGVGLALKLAQRAQCLERGIDEMRWTFDPMLWSNARFNLLRLGARVVDFIPHCYGERTDRFNTGERTDRFEVSWNLAAPIGGRLVEPVAGDVEIEIPRDYQTLRETEPARAADWRARVGDALESARREGRRVVGLGENGWIVRTGGDEPGRDEGEGEQHGQVE